MHNKTFMDLFNNPTVDKNLLKRGKNPLCFLAFTFISGSLDPLSLSKIFQISDTYNYKS